MTSIAIPSDSAVSHQAGHGSVRTSGQATGTHQGKAQAFRPAHGVVLKSHAPLSCGRPCCHARCLQCRCMTDRLPISLSLLGLAFCVASAATAQIAPPAQASMQVHRDTHEFSDFIRPPVEPSRIGARDETRFSVLSQGGPWSQSDAPALPVGARAALALAHQGRWPALAQELKARQPNPDVRDEDGATLLTLAARAGELPTVQDLLRRGADPDRRGVNGLTPLAAAAMRGHELVVRELLRAHADVNRMSANGQAPLHLAARTGHTRVVQQLLKAKADPKAWNRDGRHALSEAAWGGQIPAMQALVAGGLPASTPDQHGLNALHAAALGRRFEAAAWLQARGVQVAHPLTQVLMDKPPDPINTTP